MMTPTPRKHAAMMHAFADGHDIQMLCEDDDIEVWADCPNPDWTARTYRIKPAPKYPKSTLAYHTLCDCLNEARHIPGNEGHETKALRLCADRAVATFISSGEMDKYLLERVNVPA